VIIRSPEDSYRVTADRYDYLRDYTRGEGPERENIYDRLEPSPPTPREPPVRAPAQESPAAPPAKPPEGEASPALPKP